MNSENNRKELARACGKYLLACRMSSVSEIKQDVLTKRGPYTVFKDNLHAKEVIVGDGERRFCIGNNINQQGRRKPFL
ncbi:MAG: hypothetical protein ISS63_05585 [Desulfobacteraceae bacterium]|nr:hypothetical protein [Desulfobacteraceae bacterium]